MNTFANLGLAPRILENVAALGMTEPTPIQQQAIPALIKGRDLLGLAKTGTGKTAAFGLPMIQQLIAHNKRPNPGTVRALVLAPTRELATQIHDNLVRFAAETPIRVFRVVGGASLFTQSERLKRGVDILVATPGRLIDLLDRRALTLSETKTLVLDEADQMLDIGFIHALRKIATLIPRERQTMLFSATMPKLMEELADTYLRDPLRVQVNPPGAANEAITQGIHFVNQGDKAKLLDAYLKKHPGELAVVFNRTKHGSDKLAKLLTAWGHNVAAIHGNKSQNQRERTLQEFRDGKVQVLVATDVAARGLDIPEVRHVYNYDLPNVPENYVHRIGRTARAGMSGIAVAFCGPDELAELRDIEKMLKGEIPTIGGERPPVFKGPSLAPGGRKPQGGRGGKPQGAKPQGAKPVGEGAKRPPRRPSRAPKSGGGAAPRKANG